MHSIPRVVLATLFLFWTFAPALPQSEKQDVASTSPEIVTVAVNAEVVRFTAPNRVVQLRLEIYSELGQKLFDTEQRGGNVLDWPVQNGSGERLADGSYLCVVTIKNLSGRLKQKLGQLTVSAQTAAMRSVTAAELSSQQTEAVGPVDGDTALTIMPTGELLPATVLLTNGAEAQLSRTAGALSFRLGDFYSGKHKEQMRLTEDGNLGIGTAEPKAKLDVAGTIRTTEGIEFANGLDGTNGTKLTTTAAGGLQQIRADGTVVPSATGTGTQNFISKWIDNAGTLGDSNIFESAAGRVGLGTTNPGAKFHVVGAQGSIGAGTFQLDGATLFNNWTSAYPAFEVLNTNPTNNNISLFQFSDAPSGAAHAGIGAVATSHANKWGDLFFFTKQNDGYQMRMGIYGGNVGIGTTAPAAKLDVAGAINTSTQFNIGGQSALRVSLDGTSTFAGFYTGPSTVNSGDTGAGRYNSFFGSAAGYSNIQGAFNSFFGKNAGFLNTAGGGNSFFGSYAGLNNTGSENSFFGESAGYFNTTGNLNSSFGFYAGQKNQSGTNNTFLGAASDGDANLTNSTAVGYRAYVTQSDSLILGGIIDVNSATADTKVGIGTTAPTNRLSVVGNVDFSGNLGVGRSDPTYKLHVTAPSIQGLRVETGLNGVALASFGGFGYFDIDAPGIFGGRFTVRDNGNVGIGVPSPGAKLQVAGGDVAITTQLSGLILRAIDGPNCYRLTVNNAGAPGTTLVPCP
ncbi:MAG: hypothetical protein ABJB61_13905 [bacterium]